MRAMHTPMGLIFICSTIMIFYLSCFNNIVVLCENRSNKLIDDYIKSAQIDCYGSKQLLSCFKYYTSSFLWTLTIDKINNKRFAHNKNDKFKLIEFSHLGNEELIPEARFVTENSKFIEALKVGTRAINSFLTSHGFRIPKSNSKTRKIRKKKWNIIVPLVIFLKLLDLKLTLIPILFGVGTIQVILLAAGVALFTLLRTRTLCNLQPNLLHAHTHVNHPFPENWNDFSPTSYVTNKADAPVQAKEWSDHQAYGAYDFLDLAHTQ